MLLKNPVTLDVKTTTAAKGNAHTLINKLVTIQVKQAHSPVVIFTKENFKDVLPILDGASCIVGSNLKFDLSWVERELGWKASCVWDCQLAEFMFSKQLWKYPDLNTTLLNYGFEPKLDIVKTEYWDKGIDTDQIPLDILSEYGAYVVEGTYNVFLKQIERFKTAEEHMFRLFRLHCNDLLVLQEMEMNGICYDEYNSLAQAEGIVNRVNKIEGQLNEFTNGLPINWDSRDDVSTFLYGGTIQVETRIPIGVFKSGAKLGQTRFKVLRTDYKVDQKVQPLKGSELKKEGYYSTEESTLLSLKPNKEAKFSIIKLLERSKLMKLKSTYLEGLPKTIATHGWEPNMLYSNLNQCMAITGRLTSTKPNQQNFCKEVKALCVTRFN